MIPSYLFKHSVNGRPRIHEKPSFGLADSHQLWDGASCAQCGQPCPTDCCRIRGFVSPDFGRAQISALLTPHIELFFSWFSICFYFPAQCWQQNSALGQSRRFSVCGAGQGGAVRSRMCLHGQAPGNGGERLSEGPCSCLRRGGQS